MKTENTKTTVAMRGFLGIAIFLTIACVTGVAAVVNNNSDLWVIAAYFAGFALLVAVFSVCAIALKRRGLW